jgi:hypothetical protein
MYFKHLKSILFAIYFVNSSLTFSSTYYVSHNGNGNGTISSPLSFSSAIAKTLVAGDSLILRGGIYNFSAKQTISMSGNANYLIHIVAYNSEIPVFDFRTQAYGTAGVSLSGNYVHFKGITIQGAGDNGLYVTGNNNLIEKCLFRWNCDSGLQMKTGSNNLILNCDAYENFDYKTGGTANPDFGGNADGFADKQYTNTGTNVYRGCRSWMNSDDGWDHYQKIGNSVCDSCFCYANGPASFDMTDHIRFKTDSATWFYQFKNTSGRYIIKNYGNGNGFKLGGDYTAHNAVLRNCVSVLNSVKGFDQNNNSGNMTLYNCSGYMNNPDYGFSNSSYGTLIIKNSVTLSSKSANKFLSKSVSQTFNSWNAGFSCLAGYFISLDYQQLLNNRDVDGSLSEISFLHQLSTSGMIDKGTNLGFPYNGLAPDLGAFEFNLYSAISNNEFKNGVSVNYSGSKKEICLQGEMLSVHIYNIRGQKVFSNKVSTNEISISTSNWDKGVFFIVVNSSKEIYTSNKILIQ